jgi:hypothetical protein
MVSEEAAHECMVEGQWDPYDDVDVITGLAQKHPWWIPRSTE